MMRDKETSRQKQMGVQERLKELYIEVNKKKKMRKRSHAILSFIGFGQKK